MPLKIIRNDILQMNVDVIVNPTNTNLSGSGSIDFKIHQAGKEKLKEELKLIGGKYVRSYYRRCCWI